MKQSKATTEIWGPNPLDHASEILGERYGLRKDFVKERLPMINPDIGKAFTKLAKMTASKAIFLLTTIPFKED